jgi:hypothetical protein
MFTALRTNWNLYPAENYFKLYTSKENVVNVLQNIINYLTHKILQRQFHD